MAQAGSIVVDLLMKTGSFETDAQRASKTFEKRTKEMERQAKETASAVSGAFAGLLSGALLGVGIGTIFGKFIEETKNAQNEQAQLAAVLKSTGNAAGFTAAELNKMASGMAGFVSEGDINRAQTRLLSYTGVVGEEFPRALQAAIDMSVRLGMTVEQSAETIGKALDVPSKGLTALSKQGFRFTEDQEKLVKKLEETGRVAEAQDIVLKALEASYGGAAEAARNTLGGALQALQNQIDDLMTGDDGSVNGMTDAINELTDVLGSDETKMAFASFLEGLASISTKAVQMASDFVTAADKAGGALKALAAFGPGNGIGSLFRNNAENIQATQKELADLAAMQDRLNAGTAKWNDYNQKSLDVARTAAQARLSYYQGQVSRQENEVFAAYRGIGETGMDAPMLSPTAVYSSGGREKKEKKAVDQGQKLIDQMEKRIALIGKETEYEKLLAEISAGSVSFRTQAQQDEALAAAQTIDFLTEQQKAYAESMKRAESLKKVMADLFPENSALDEYTSKLSLLTEALDEGTLSASQYDEAVARLNSNFGDETDQMSEFAAQAARNIQDSLGDTTYQLLKGNFDDIGSAFSDMIVRMIANAASANLAQALFGDFGRSGQIGGIIGSAISGYFGGGSGVSPTADQLGAAGDGIMYFAGGGYTGDGGRMDPAGVVHKGEYVFDADSTRRLGVGFLSRLRGYADGGYVGASGLPVATSASNTRVEIINNGTPQQVTGADRGFDIGGEVIRIVVNDMQKNGRSAQAVRSVMGG